MSSFAQCQDSLNAKSLRRFGALVQLNSVAVLGDFSAATKDREVAGMFVSASDPACIVAELDVPENPVSKAFVNADGEAFTVASLRLDGFGLAVLILQKGL